MTVEGIEKHPADASRKGLRTDEQIRTIWFDAHGMRQEALFFPHLLALEPKAAAAKEAEHKAASDRAAETAEKERLAATEREREIA